ncbi:MAG: hypothetical protein AAF432_15620, partial [Planctomycetota bacterium]
MRWNRLLFVTVGSVMTMLAAAAHGQDVTTVLCHGYSLDQTKGAWVQGMAEAMRDRAISEGIATSGAIVRYDQASGAWRMVSGTLTPGQPVFCIYRWLNDFDKPGPNAGYAEGAADAMYAALRDPQFVDQLGSPIAGIELVNGRDLHLVGHSRGTIVNSEVSRRFAREGLTVDHVTGMDPHPVNGTLDADPNWGDPVPMRWENNTFVDVYYRADGAFLLNAFDFDGIPIPTAFNTQLSESALNSGGYTFAHSDTHLWLHGTIDLSPTPCDGEACITTSMRNNWWPEGFTERGYYYALLGGGAVQRPALGPGMPVTNPAVLYNGDFGGNVSAGWLFHGGSLNAQLTNDGGNGILRLAGAGSLAEHNRFYLPVGIAAIAADLRVVTPDTGDVVEISLVDADGISTVVWSMAADSATGWMPDLTMALPGTLPRGRTYQLQAQLVDGVGTVSATVDLDDIRFIEGPSCPADCAPDNGDGTFGNGMVNIDDLLSV